MAAQVSQNRPTLTAITAVSCEQRHQPRKLPELGVFSHITCNMQRSDRRDAAECCIHRTFGSLWVCVAEPIEMPFGADSRKPNEPRVRWGWTLAPHSEYNWSTRRGGDLALSNYFHHLFLFHGHTLHMTVDSQNHYGIQAIQAKSYVTFPVSDYGPWVGFTTRSSVNSAGNGQKQRLNVLQEILQHC